MLNKKERKKQKQIRRIKKMSNKMPTKMLFMGRNRIKTKDNPTEADKIALGVIDEELKRRNEI